MLAEDAAQRQVRGSDVIIDITAMDETYRRVKVSDVIALLARHNGFGIVGFVGVQSNQFPRALALAAVAGGENQRSDRRFSRSRLLCHAAIHAG
jgi:hypothetical protein